MGLGITNMGELIIVTLLAGGMLEMIRYNGGIDWIILKLTSRIRSTKGAEGSIAALISFANLCTANNTIALIMAGPIAKDIADRLKSIQDAVPVCWTFFPASYKASYPTARNY